MKILNSQGNVIVLNQKEQMLADRNQRIVNELGAEIDITTLTTIIKKVSEQKFFEIAPADFLPIRVGEGAWSSSLTTYLSSMLGGSFEEGIINAGSSNSRMASADAGVEPLSVPVHNWGKTIGWNLIELEQAMKAGNWDLVTAREESRKKNWDLGIQSVAFVGLAGNTSVLGLLNQSGITANTALITKAISAMSTSELKIFVAGVLDAYRVNCARTAWPTHFAIPESDYLGLASPASADYPIKSTLEVLEDTFKIMTKNPNFKIMPCAYGDNGYNSLGVQRYALYNYDEKSLRMDIPVDYTNTMANSVDNFSFQNVGYGQFTGAKAYRPKEMIYFQYTP